MEMWQLILYESMDGVVWGLILAMISLGLCLIFGLMGLMNVAHASLYMLGAVLAAYFTASVGLDFWEALVIAPLVIAALSALLNRLVLLRVAGRSPAIGLLATAGLLLVIDNSVLATFGSTAVPVSSPFDGALTIGGIPYPLYRLLVAGMAIIILGAIFCLLKYTRYGLWMRAVPQAPELAAAVGVPIRRVNDLTVLLSGGLAGLAGVLVAPITGAHFQMGIAILASAFIVIVLGGMGNLLGAVVIAILLGLCRGIFAVYLTPTLAEVMSLLVLLLVLLVRPNGLFGARA